MVQVDLPLSLGWFWDEQLLFYELDQQVVKTLVLVLLTLLMLLAKYFFTLPTKEARCLEDVEFCLRNSFLGDLETVNQKF
ncbi:hypothetical protein GTQ43_18030 [Nostoc sp. KVJ3]|uniref:hypothetical protein n=1 Tax=Nostoc sp. KVJ3 TaxID=457945 RepID=UPI002236F61F|nr:hypothetical protein [Nostoc sp. KVJ3]MCW5315640.1 hypothetical protein [Nostoc sp. KVJ3]